ncbi:MAG: hypothetical protein ACR2PK_05225 [Acidimicrobiales bacterium]
MTDNDSGQSEDTAQIDHEAEFARIRTRISGLGDAIQELSSSADELIRSADSRTALAMLDRPAEVDEDHFDRLETSIAALGRHAANTPEEFDPTPLDAGDPDYPGDSSAAFGDLSTGTTTPGEQLGAGDPESAFGNLGEEQLLSKPPSSADVEPLQLETTAQTHEANEVDPPAAVGADGSGVEHVSESDDGSGGAQVLEFVPRSERTEEPDGEAPAFGAIAEHASETSPQAEFDERPARAKPPPPSDTELAFGGLAEQPEPAVADNDVDPSSTDDGLDAIAEAESTDAARQWDSIDQDSDAFDKFFSNEVEPEPAQRWLLNE